MPKDFNSHARVGRDWIEQMVLVPDTDFNSHARVGRDQFLHKNLSFKIISTHTPV